MHESRGLGDVYKRQADVAMPESSILLASNLMEAYNIAEHHRPDCIMLASELAARPDFELLGYLLKQLGIGCVIWGGRKKILAPFGSSSMHYFDPMGPKNTLKNVILLATRTRPIEDQRYSFGRQSVAYDPRHILLIGASTGGVDALAKILSHFNKETPSTLVVQHTGGRFVKSLIRLLDSGTDATVQPALHDALLKPGTVYLAPDDSQHLGVSDICGQRIALTAAEPMSGHRPSVDVLFQSAVGHGRHVTAALLTGMGQDGARGLKALREAGAHTIAQDQATSVVYGMPRIATEIDAAVEQLPLAEIGPAMLNAARLKARA